MDEETGRRFDTLEGQIERMRVQIMGVLESHSNELTAIRGDLGVNINSLNVVAGAGANARAEVSNLTALVANIVTTLTGMQAAFNRLRTEFDDHKRAA
jgi:hypothetical protein